MEVSAKAEETSGNETSAAKQLEAPASQTQTAAAETSSAANSTENATVPSQTEGVKDNQSAGQTVPTEQAAAQTEKTENSSNVKAPSQTEAETTNKTTHQAASPVSENTTKTTANSSENTGKTTLKNASTEITGKSVSDSSSKGSNETQTSKPATPSGKDDKVTESTYNPKTGLTESAYQIAQEAGLDISKLTAVQKQALNRMKMNQESQSGTQMTYKQFQDIADVLVKQDPRYAIPYFKADAIRNMPAATTRDAQTGQVADLDVWDSWPVQDVKTGEVVNWNGYQLVVAMMGVPNTNDNHIYLLYNKYGDNDLKHWKNAGSIFGYNQNALTQQWSGSATVNDDGTLQLYYTKVDTSDNNSNNQKLASATLKLSFDDENVHIDSVENDKVLTPNGGDGYYYQSYKQWRSTYTGADNIAMRDPHVIEDDKGDRYLVFEASTGSQNYQGEDQIYNWKNYGGDAAYNVKSLFRFLEDSDMYERASISNAAIGILKLTGDVKSPEVAEYYTPLISSPMVSDEIERPNVVKLGDKYYLFAASRLNHGSNNDAWHHANDIVGDNVVMLGYVSDKLTGGYKPLNNNGAVLTASVPADWRTATYSYYAVPVAGSKDKVLITAYMTNRNEVAGKGKNSTWAPSFLLQILPDNTTKVLAKMTQQGDWIWDESSETQDTVGTLDTAHLPGENDGYIDWNVIGGYGLKPHTPDSGQDQNPTDNKKQDNIITINYNFNFSGSSVLTKQDIKDFIKWLAPYLTGDVNNNNNNNNLNVKDNTVTININYNVANKSQDETKSKKDISQEKKESKLNTIDSNHAQKASVNPLLAPFALGLTLVSGWFGFKKFKKD
ncbi:glycoside hydrolase family 68 protein [Streptococcus macacae]